MSAEYQSLSKAILVSAVGTVDPDMAQRISHGQRAWNIAKTAMRNQGEHPPGELDQQIERSLNTVRTSLSTTFEDYDDIPKSHRQGAEAMVASVIRDQRLAHGDLLDSSLNPTDLYRILQPQLDRKMRKELFDSQSSEYAQRLLKESCAYLIGLAVSLPNIQDQMTLRTFVSARKLEEGVQVLIDDLLVSRARQRTHTSRFEADVKRSILAENRYLEIFGLSVDPELRRQRIDLAYISLHASGRVPPGMPQNMDAQTADKMGLPNGIIWSKGEFLVEGVRVERALLLAYNVRTAFIKNAGLLEHSSIRAGAASNDLRLTTRPAEPRLLAFITGAAGAGKTTICQWLATKLAREEWRDLPPSFGGATPLLIKLRSINFSESASDGFRLLDIPGIRERDAPDGWLEGKLTEGAALVMFDGLDELRPFDRAKAVAWIHSIVDNYASVNVIVTSRTEDANPAEFQRMGFFHLDLAPLALTDALGCVNKWFRAMEDVVPYPIDKARLRLTSDLERNLSLRDSAQTPLIVSMLCAFYAHSADGIPETRGELYQKVIDVLLDRRERDRGSIAQEWSAFRLKDKRVLLEAVAAAGATTNDTTGFGLRTHLPLNDRASRSLGGDENAPTLEGTLTTVIAEMPNAFYTASEVRDFLIKRSSILIKASRYECQFVHRSFNEYFYAEWLAKHIEQVAVPDLLMTDSGRSVLSFLVHSVRAEDAAQIISALCDAYDEVRSREVALLLAESMGSVSQLSTALTIRAREIVRTVVPPRTLNEAKDLASHGPVVLEWVDSWATLQQQIGESVALPIIHLCALLSSRRSVYVLSRVIQKAPVSTSILVELNSLWPMFQDLGYEQDVLGPAFSRSDRPLEVAEEWMLAECSELKEIRGLRVSVHARLGSFKELTSLPALRFLELMSAGELTSLTGLDAFPGLHELDLGLAPKLVTLDGCQEVSLRRFAIRQADALANASPVASPRLRNLSLGDTRSLSDFDFLASCLNLEYLTLRHSRFVDGELLSKLIGLRLLDLEGCRVESIGLEEFERLQYLVAPENLAAMDFRRPLRLRGLRLNQSLQVDELAQVLEPEGLTTLDLLDLPSGGGQDLGTIAPGLRSLTLRSTQAVEDLRFLGVLESVRHLKIAGEHLETISGVERFTQLETLDLRGSKRVGVMDSLWDMPSLKVLTVDAEQGILLESLPRPLPSHIEVRADEFWVIGHDVG